MHSESPRFYGRVEALRGIAAGMVALGHVTNALLAFSPAATGYGIFRAFGKGESAVLMFFVISGFVLFFALDRYWRGDKPVTRFLIARAFRIYPAAIATVALIVIIVATIGRPFQGIAVIDPILILKNMLLIDVSINGVMWTLQVELVAAPIIAGAYIVYRRFGEAALWTMLAVFTALSFARWFNHLIGTPMIGLHAFMLGMIVAAAGNRWCQRISQSNATIIFVSATIAFFASAPVLGWTSHWGTLVATACAGIMIALAAFNDVGPGLASRPMRFLGRISFGFYLLHPLTLFALEQPEIRSMITQMMDFIGTVRPMIVAVFLLSVLMIVPLAYLMLLMVERPGIAMGRRLVQLCCALRVERSAHY